MPLAAPSISLEQEQSSSPSGPFIHKGRGLVLVKSKECLLNRKELERVEGIQSCGLRMTFDRKFTQRLQALVLGQPIDFEVVRRVKAEIYRYYQRAGHPFVEITAPKQDVTAGVLQLVVSESALSDIKVKGNRYFSTEYYEKNISIRKEGDLDLNSVMKDLNFFNKNPFRIVDAIYAPGKQPCTTDLTLMVQEKTPFRFYLGGDNTGIQSINRNRLIVGFSCGKMFKWDHVFTFQYTASPDLQQFQSYTIQYLALLSWHDLLSLYGGYSLVRTARLSFPASTNHGQSTQTSLRYTHPFLPHGTMNHEVTLGFDFKRTNNTVLFSQLYDNYAQNVNLTQLAAIYQGDYDGGKFRIHWDVGLFWSPGEWLPDQTNADYQSLRPGAKNRYLYGKGSFRYFQRLPKSFSYTLWLRGQIASQNLLPSEQYGIGGYDTVRGYEERQLNMDGAFVLNNEIRTPPLPIFSRKKKADAFQFLVFLDYGWGKNHNPIPGEPLHSFLLGAGPGVRYTFDPWITGRLDWGFKWHTSTLFSGGGSMFHFSLIANI